MLVEHGQAARGYADVRANTVSAFALGDYEWILAFEAPELHRIVDLVLERAALARELDTPVTADLAADAAARPVREATVGELPPYRSVCRPNCCEMRAASPTGIPAACSTDPLS